MRPLPYGAGQMLQPEGTIFLMSESAGTFARFVAVGGASALIYAIVLMVLAEQFAFGLCRRHRVWDSHRVQLRCTLPLDVPNGPTPQVDRTSVFVAHRFALCRQCIDHGRNAESIEY